MTCSIPVLPDFLAAAVDDYPDHTAVRHGRAWLTYRSLAANAERIAAWLTSVGVRGRDRVVVALPEDVLLPAVLYACARAGAVFVVLQIGTPAAVAAHVLDDAEPTIVLTDNAVLCDLATARGLPIYGLDVIRNARVRRRIQPVAPLAVDPVCLIYTSGCTAMPKAVVSTHQQVTFAATAIQSQLGYRSSDIVFCALPLSFDYGLYQIFLCTLTGAELHLAGTSAAGPQLAANLRAASATVLPLVPSLAANLAMLLSRRPDPLPRLRLLTSTGAAMPAGPLAELRSYLDRAQVQLMYGLTECKRATIMPKDADLLRPGACGIALPGTEVVVVGEDGRQLPAGETGEIVVRGPNVMAGYWRSPELTAQRFERVEGLFPQLRTGDLGRLDCDGYLYFTGRRDDMYKERGFRVSAVEVEAVACRVPGVEAAAVVLPAPGEESATLVVQTSKTAVEVLRGIRERLEENKVPARCVVVPELPLNGNGKVDRSQLASLLVRD